MREGCPFCGHGRLWYRLAPIICRLIGHSVLPTCKMYDGNTYDECARCFQVTVTLTRDEDKAMLLVLRQPYLTWRKQEGSIRRGAALR